jgi:hypothetical protein
VDNAIQQAKIQVTYHSTSLVTLRLQIGVA